MTSHPTPSIFSSRTRFAVVAAELGVADAGPVNHGGIERLIDGDGASLYGALHMATGTTVQRVRRWP
jgi:hypothetical protein